MIDKLTIDPTQINGCSITYSTPKGEYQSSHTYYNGVCVVCGSKKSKLKLGGLNYKTLLKKYMRYVELCETITFVKDGVYDYDMVGITKEEWEYLQKLDKSIKDKQQREWNKVKDNYYHGALKNKDNPAWVEHLESLNK